MNIYKNIFSTEEIRHFSVLRPGRVVVDTILCWVFIVCCWLLMFWYPSPWTYILGLPIIGSRFYALLIIGHDGVHRRLFSSRAVNDRFSDIAIYGPLGLVIRLMDRNHLNHHKYLYTDADPDQYKYTSNNKRTRIELLLYSLGLSGLLTEQVKKIYLRKDLTIDRDERRTPKLKRNPIDLLIILTWQFFLIGGLSFAFGWWGYFVLWLMPVYIFAILADSMRSFCEHSQPEFDEPHLISYVSNFIERFFISPMNMNYHAAHHLWPSIPYYNLKSADVLLREKLKNIGDASVEWRGSYLSYYINYWLKLPYTKVAGKVA